MISSLVRSVMIAGIATMPRLCATNLDIHTLDVRNELFCKNAYEWLQL